MTLLVNSTGDSAAQGNTQSPHCTHTSKPVPTQACKKITFTAIRHHTKAHRWHMHVSGAPAGNFTTPCQLRPVAVCQVLWTSVAVGALRGYALNSATAARVAPSYTYTFSGHHQAELLRKDSPYCTTGETGRGQPPAQLVVSSGTAVSLGSPRFTMMPSLSSKLQSST